jgi:uncharacterized protein (TIGR03435 family)
LVSNRREYSAGSTKEQMRLMEQNLLAERFKLAAHFVNKEMQIYEMTVGAGGVKFKEWADLPPLADGPTPGDRVRSGTLKAADLRPLPDSPVEWQSIDGRHSRRGKHSMEFLAAYLSGQLERPVLDATGLTGEYDITLDFVMEPRRVNLPGVAPEVSLAAGPTLVKAVETQLGLRMESKKGMIDVLVIDHVEKVPTEN